MAKFNKRYDQHGASQLTRKIQSQYQYT